MALLHALLLAALFSAHVDASLPPPERVVRVALLPSPPQPLTPPTAMPRLAPAPAVTATLPQFRVKPPPDAIRAAPVAVPPAPPVAAMPASQPAAGLPPDYLDRLAAHLNAYRVYPYEARIRREEGTVELRFSLDSQGHVRSFAVVRSSGSAALDQEAGEMMRRADPFPPPPVALGGGTLDLTVPVIFALH